MSIISSNDITKKILMMLEALEDVVKVEPKVKMQHFCCFLMQSRLRGVLNLIRIAICLGFVQDFLD